jgi:hypothetical protein
MTSAVGDPPASPARFDSEQNGTGGAGWHPAAAAALSSTAFDGRFTAPTMPEATGPAGRVVVR